MWSYEEDLVRSTSREEILEGVTRLVKSPWFGHTTDFTRLLGGVQRNSRGELTAARTALMVWTLRSGQCFTYIVKLRHTYSSYSVILTQSTAL